MRRLWAILIELVIFDLLWFAIVAGIVAFMLFISCGWARAGGEWAVVRVISHGGSGTVIKNTRPSLILTSAHMFTGVDGNGQPLSSKKIVLDVPSPAGAPPINPGVRLVGITGKMQDLALLQADCDLPYVCPIAPPGYQMRRPMSVGYDEMKTPYQVRPATVIREDQHNLYTRERPWHGRSGGALVDGDYLVGVVSGFSVPTDRLGRPDRRGHSQAEVYPGSEGMYINLNTIRAFVQRPTGAQSYQQFSPPRPPNDYWTRPGRQNALPHCPT